MTFLTRRAWRVEPDLDHAADEFVSYEVGRQTEDVGVVVSAAHVGGQFVVAERRPYPRDLVGYDGRSDPCPAEQDASFRFTARHTEADGNGIVRVVARGVGVRAVVDHFVPHVGQKAFDAFLGVEPAMVASERNLHQTISCTRLATASSTRRAQVRYVSTSPPNGSATSRPSGSIRQARSRTSGARRPTASRWWRVMTQI